MPKRRYSGFSINIEHVKNHSNEKSEFHTPFQCKVAQSGNIYKDKRNRFLKDRIKINDLAGSLLNHILKEKKQTTN